MIPEYPLMTKAQAARARWKLDRADRRARRRSSAEHKRQLAAQTLREGLTEADQGAGL